MFLEQGEELPGTGLSGHHVEGFFLFPEGDRRHDVTEVPLQFRTDGVLGIGFRIDPVLQTGIPFRAEQLFQDGAAHFLVGGQQFAELALGDHDDLHELVPGQAEQFLDLRGHFLDLARHRFPVPVEQDRLLQLVLAVDQHFLTAFFVHTPEDPVLAAAAGEGEVDIGGRILSGIFAGQVFAAAVAAARLPVQGIDDGIEQGRLPRSGVTGDEVQSALPEFREVQRRDAGIGAEGGQSQSQGSHSASPPHSSVIRPFSRSSCSARSSLPVCSRKNPETKSKGSASSSSCTERFEVSKARSVPA